MPVGLKDGRVLTAPSFSSNHSADTSQFVDIDFGFPVICKAGQPIPFHLIISLPFAVCSSIVCTAPRDLQTVRSKPKAPSSGRNTTTIHVISSCLSPGPRIPSTRNGPHFVHQDALFPWMSPAPPVIIDLVAIFILMQMWDCGRRYSNVRHAGRKSGLVLAHSRVASNSEVI